MTPEDILDAIGEIDETYVRKAKAVKPRKVIFSLAAAAACLTLVLLMPFGISAGNESAADENKKWPDTMGENELVESGTPESDKTHQDIAIETAPAGDDLHGSVFQAQIREYGSEIITCLGTELSEKLYQVLEQVKAENQGISGAVDLGLWGYQIDMRSDEGTVTKYILQDHCLYDQTNGWYYVMNDGDLALLLAAMGVD